MDTIPEAERKLDYGDRAGLDFFRVENQNAGQARVTPVGNRDQKPVSLGSYDELVLNVPGWLDAPGGSDSPSGALGMKATSWSAVCSPADQYVYLPVFTSQQAIVLYVPPTGL